MKIGFPFFGIQATKYPAVAAKADEVGFESCWMPEHLVLPVEISPTYPYSVDGLPPIRSHTQMYDPWVTLSFVAAASKKLLMGTNVYVLPLRNPFVTARTVATLDMMSGGRLILGCGIGWFEEEFNVVGEGFKNRAGRTVEIVEILKKLWTEDTIEYHGKYYDFGPVKFEPKPTQRPFPPIHFGGTSAPAIRRVGQLADGWIGMSHTPDEVREIVGKIHEARKEYDRERDPLDITVQTGVTPTVDQLRKFEEAGVTRATVVPWGKPEGRLTVEHVSAGMEDYADKVLSKLT